MQLTLKRTAEQRNDDDRLNEMSFFPHDQRPITISARSTTRGGGGGSKLQVWFWLDSWLEMTDWQSLAWARHECNTYSRHYRHDSSSSSSPPLRSFRIRLEISVNCYYYWYHIVEEGDDGVSEGSGAYSKLWFHDSRRQHCWLWHLETNYRANHEVLLWETWHPLQFQGIILTVATQLIRLSTNETGTRIIPINYKAQTRVIAVHPLPKRFYFSNKLKLKVLREAIKSAFNL